MRHFSQRRNPSRVETLPGDSEKTGSPSTAQGMSTVEGVSALAGEARGPPPELAVGVGIDSFTSATTTAADDRKPIKTQLEATRVVGWRGSRTPVLLELGEWGQAIPPSCGPASMTILSVSLALEESLPSIL